MTTPTFRRFLIENSIGEILDLSASPDLFAFNPEGLGVSIDNDFVASGGSFLVNKREINPNEITLKLLMGAREMNPYVVYADLIRILSKPPYNLIYITPVGEWRRVCVVNELSKSEINPEFSVMMEQIVFKCSTPWYNDIYNEYPVPPQQWGDGKIYSKHTNWKYATDGYKSAPLTGYTANEYWLSDPTELFPGKNLAKNMYYDELYINITKPVQTIFTFDTPQGDNPEWFIIEADVDATQLVGNTTIKFASGTETVITTDTTHIRITMNKPIRNEVYIKDGSGSIVLKGLYITYSRADNTNIAQGKYSPPLYWNTRDKNLLGDQTGVAPLIFTTTDGNSDARLKYSLIPAIYPKHQPYIYEAEYEFDYRFGDWYVAADTIKPDDLDFTEGNIGHYSAYFGNSGSSEDDISVRIIYYKDGLATKVVNSNVSIKPGNYEHIVFNNVELAKTYDYIEIQLFKVNKDKKVLSMGASYASKRIYIEDNTPVLLLTNTTRASLLESDWTLAENPEKTPDGEFYGYIYNYVYDADEKAANTYLIENKSLYLRSQVNSPCEITIHGPAKNPRWELLVDSQVKYTDGFKLTVPTGFKLVVSSLPNEQKAVLVGPDGSESNVYQQQNLAMTNFIRIPPGDAILMVYGANGEVGFKYREERDVV